MRRVKILPEATGRLNVDGLKKRLFTPGFRAGNGIF